MKKGLRILNGSPDSVVLDADNLFWAITAEDKDSIFIPRNILKLYNRVDKQLDSQMEQFRFSQELTAIYIDPTDRCNANYGYCYIPREIRTKGRSMTEEELDFILNKLERYFKRSKRKQVIIFHAAEPLLVKHIIFKAIKKYKNVFKFGLQTNATLLEKGDVNSLKSHFVGVGVSLDSHKPRVNDRQRPIGSTGNFAKTVKAIQWFDGYPGLNVICTVTKHNVNDLTGTVKFLHALKVPCVLFNPVRFTRVSPSALKPNEKVLAEHFIAAADEAIKLTRKSGRKIIIGNFANTILAIIAPEARRLMCDISPCGGGRCFFTITAKGEMIPCGEFIGIKGFSGGNIFKDGIAKALASKPFKKVRERIVEKIDACAECEFRNICGAPCPAELHSRGNMYQKAIFCDFYKEIIRYGFKIISQDKVRFVLRDEALKQITYRYKLS